LRAHSPQGDALRAIGRDELRHSRRDALDLDAPDPAASRARQVLTAHSLPALRRPGDNGVGYAEPLRDLDAPLAGLQAGGDHGRVDRGCAAHCAWLPLALSWKSPPDFISVMIEDAPLRRALGFPRIAGPRSSDKTASYFGRSPASTLSHPARRNDSVRASGISIALWVPVRRHRGRRMPSLLAITDNGSGRAVCKPACWAS